MKAWLKPFVELGIALIPTPSKFLGKISYFLARPSVLRSARTDHERILSG